MGTHSTRRIKIGWLAYQTDAPTIDEGQVTDIQFPLSGYAIPVDNGLALFQEICRILPWMKDDEYACIHAIHPPEPGLSEILLNRRAKLTVRVPRERVRQTLGQLQHQELHLHGRTLAIGSGKVRALQRHTPLFAHFVCTGNDDETRFAADIIRILDEMNIDSRFICGKRQQMQTAEGVVSGFSLMLHGLPVEHSILVQQRGLGLHRKIGCGVFIPHKSINALT